MHRLPDGKLIVSATDLVGFLECGHLSALDLAVANGELEKPHFTDATLDLIRDRGGQHEGRYIEQLEREGHTITRLDGDRKRPYEERAAETIDAMRRGDDVIYQATVFDGTWVGHPDFLLRVGEPGELGKDHHYEVADTKLAHSAKASALIQICSYVDQIEQIQGITPERLYVVTGGANIESHPFRTAEMMAYYRHAKERFEQALAGLDHTKSYPDPVEHCGVCRWQAIPRELDPGVFERIGDLLASKQAERVAERSASYGADDTTTGIDDLRRQYKPAKVRTLFVGESSPAQGTHFYRANSNLFRSTRAAYAAALGKDAVPEGEAFLRFFADKGGWLVDLADLPVNRLSGNERRAAVEAGVPRLAQTIRKLKPQSLVIVKRDIADAVERAAEAARSQATTLILPFPVRQWAPVYERELAAFLRAQGVAGASEAG